MQVDFAPRKSLRAWLLDGWRLIPGHTYNPADYAILLFKPDVPSEITTKWINAVAKRFDDAAETKSNRSSGASSRNHARYRREPARAT